MKKKNQQTVPEEIPGTWNNPFIGLKLDLPKEESPPPPPPPPPKPEDGLSKADRELLRVFEAGGCVSVGHDGNPSRPGRPCLSFSIQRKGKGGKTVTLVRGLERLDMLEQMAICSRLKTALGCGARFDNGVLEIQGDQRGRAAAWFEEQELSR